jgi:hypothetical protein
MKQKLDEKATGLTSVRNDEAAGANPAKPNIPFGPATILISLMTN